MHRHLGGAAKHLYVDPDMKNLVGMELSECMHFCTFSRSLESLLVNAEYSAVPDYGFGSTGNWIAQVDYCGRNQFTQHHIYDHVPLPVICAFASSQMSF